MELSVARGTSVEADLEGDRREGGSNAFHLVVERSAPQQDGVRSARGEASVTGQEDPPFDVGPAQNLFIGEAAGVRRVEPREPEVPCEAAEHLVGQEPRERLEIARWAGHSPPETGRPFMSGRLTAPRATVRDERNS